MGINWLAEGQFKRKVREFSNNKPAIAFASIFALYVLGILWSQNVEYAIVDNLKDKVPILTLALIVVTSPAIERSKQRFLLWLFVTSVITVSLIGYVNYLIGDLSNYRHILPYGSHLYFSMMLILSAFILPWLTRKHTNKIHWKVLSYALSCWLIIFLMLIRSLSGVASLIIVVIFLIIWLAYNQRNLLVKVIVIVTFVGVLALIVGFVLMMYNTTIIKDDSELSQLEEYTIYGNTYMHDTTSKTRESGYLVYIYISNNELEDAWSERSNNEFYGYTPNKRMQNDVLYRYMSSLGLQKDKEHFMLLTDEDINAIENGIENHLYRKWPGVFIRIHQTFAGVQYYKETNNPHWSTLAQRIELWNASYEAFKKKPLIGWGTGDILMAVQYGLEKNGSFFFVGMDVKPHNQLLLFLNTFGIFGLVLIIILYWYVTLKTKAFKNMPYKVFMVAFLVNMLGNNPLDAQIGITMFSYFTLFFGFVFDDEKK